MNTIYLVARGPYVSDILEGFAINEAGIRQIVANDHSKYNYIDTDKLDIRVDIEKRVAIIVEEWDTTYYIHAMQLVSG